VELVAIAVTPTFAQMAFADKLGIDFPLLSDWEGATCAAYGVRYDSWKGHKGLAKRSVFVMDRNGRITYTWSSDDALTLPGFDEVMAAIVAVGGSDAGR
jgi:glutaredoxin-dependent peroxiredoxin